MKTLEITSNGVTAKITLRAATIADDMRYGMLVNQAISAPRPDPAEQVVAVVIYPKCLACIDDLRFAIDD